MGVKIREKPKGSGIWWVRIRHNGRDKSKKIGDKKLAMEVAEKLHAKIILGHLFTGLKPGAIQMIPKSNLCPILDANSESYS